MPPNLLLIDLPEEIAGVRTLQRPYRAGDGPAVREAVEESRGHLRQIAAGPCHNGEAPNLHIVDAFMANPVKSYSEVY